MEPQIEWLTRMKSRIPVSGPVFEAFLAIPRHHFVKEFSVDARTWHTATEEHLELIYADAPLLLYDQESLVSTISQPSFVLQMLEILDLERGMRVFELGSGSGWNAALLGHLVGREGLVRSYEIIPEMARIAQENIEAFELPQVEVIHGDALEELPAGPSFHRGIFTAGARDLPGQFLELMEDGGKLIFVLKTASGDLLLAMEKRTDHFQVYKKIPCHFVEVKGKVMETYHNDLSALLAVDGEITVWPQGTLGLGENVIVGRNVLFRYD